MFRKAKNMVVTAGDDIYTVINGKTFIKCEIEKYEILDVYFNYIFAQ